MFPLLMTKRLVLDELKPEDAEVLYHHFSEPDVVEFYDLDAFTNISQATDLIQLFARRFEDGSGIRWAMRLKDGGGFIGTCGFNSWNSRMRSTVIGYDVSKRHWGNGFATEALQAIIKQAFTGHLPCAEINRIQADTVPGNLASEAVLLKLGFKEEGLLRESGYWKGRFHDLKCFGLTRSDWQ